MGRRCRLLEIHLLGPLAVVVDGRAVPLRPGRARAVLARLALDDGRTVSRDELIRALWEDDPPASAVNVIQVAVSSLRRALGADAIRTGAAGYALGPAVVDLTEFLEGVRSGARAAAGGDEAATGTALASVLERFRPPLDDLGEEPFVVEARRSITEQYLAAVEVHADAAMRSGRPDAVVRLVTDLLPRHPLREGLLERLVLALGTLGRETEALAAYDAGRRRIADELGLDPGTRLRSAYERVLRHDASLTADARIDPPGSRVGVPVPLPPLQDPSGPGRLPTPASSFIGREQDIADLREALQANRLVTITGFGGMGKTRLALQVANGFAADHPDGVWFIDLSAVDRVDSVGSTIAESLGVDQGDDALGSVLRWMRNKRLLVVLDNLEQLLPAGALVVGRVLAGAGGVRVLATSREPLRLQGEQVFALEPLPVPPPDVASRPDRDAGALLEYPSVRLLCSRVSSVRRDFALDADTAPAIAAICRRLEGSPLALELVAVRLRSLSPRALLALLEDELASVGGGIRDLPTRQQTLRATIEWSVRMLEPEQRLLLWRLAVFPGTFTLDAARAICGPGTPTAAAIDVVGGLPELVDRSVVRFRPGSGVDRFDLLVPIREFAGERLHELEPDGVTVDRHANHFGEAVEFDPDGTREDFGALTTLVEEDGHNIRVALDRMHERGDVAREVAVSPMLGRCLQYLGREGAAISLLRHAVAHLDHDDAGDEAVSARIHLAIVEYEGDRITSGPSALIRAHQLLERSGSPALTVFLAIVNVILNDPCRLGAAFFHAANALLAALDEHGNTLPRWYLIEYWLFAAIITGVADDEVTARMQTELLASSRGREHLRLRCSLGVNLCWSGRLAEAEELLGVFADEAVRSSAYPNTRILPLVVLAEIRIATGRAGEASRVLDAAEADLAVFDQPWEQRVVPLQRAAIDRATGALDAAADRLKSLLESLDTDEVGASTGFAHWLLAVVERERGHAVAAQVQLRLAWAVASSGVEEDLTIQCLLERCVQRLDRAPAEAAADFALAVDRLGRRWMHFAVTYDTSALRDRLEAELGPARLWAVMAGAGAGDLVLPEWDGVP